MPFVIKKTSLCPASKPYGVFTETGHGTGKTTGDPHGCFTSTAKAREQQKALYANVPDAKSGEEPMTTTAPRVKLKNTLIARKARLGRRGDLEKRTLPVDRMELRSGPTMRATDDSTETVQLLEFVGYASVFGRSYTVGGIEETIESGAFKRSLGNPDLDVVLRTEHSDLPLARTTGRVELEDGQEVPTLSLNEDERGLKVRALLDPTDPDVQRLVPKYRRQDLREMSFAFRCKDDKWSEDYTQRTIRAADIHRGDVSIVTYGASPSTESTLRSEEAALELRDVGPESMIGSLQDFALHWVATYLAERGQEATVAALEERVGKVLSSQSMEALRKVLDLVATADDAVDEAQPLLADLMGVPNPDDDDDDGDEGSSAPGSSAEPQLSHLAADAAAETRALVEDLDAVISGETLAAEVRETLSGIRARVEARETYNDMREGLHSAVRDKHGYSAYMHDFDENNVHVKMDNGNHSIPYSTDEDGKIVLGDPVPTRPKTEYVPRAEGKDETKTETESESTEVPESRQPAPLPERRLDDLEAELTILSVRR